MGVIVGSKTNWECDAKDCNEKSVEDHDQIRANRLAESKGWVKNSSTGNTYCPKCKFSNN